MCKPPTVDFTACLGTVADFRRYQQVDSAHFLSVYIVADSMKLYEQWNALPVLRD